ncbi:hypothetical protein LTR56_024214 [Elasticomyces elasticus]|nr:hypothetical protein LTR56_024214 [Elasticomyces elasticus]KAK3653077.1 hypothetical protein LTR22_011315 [Elasticomyces elasticus]KAK4919680.1 hypothetical protein LTR49_012744 [Elasticomyces elasticus]KAK5749161.1 hypothetical protein LTS12_020784 [Elasticomyces elasticus]
MADIVQDDSLEAGMDSVNAEASPGEDTTTTPEEQDSTEDAGPRLANTYELLEKILLDDTLPMETVFFAQRVNKQFRSLIGRSKGLQQKLFLQPIDFHPNPASRKYVPLDGEVRINPLFAKKAVYENLPLFFTSPVTEVATYSDADTLQLHTKEPRISANVWIDDDYKIVVLDMRNMTGLDASKTLSMTGEASSWMRMYLTQPPIPVKCEVNLNNGWRQDCHATETQISLTMGQMIQTVCGDLKEWDF